MDKSKTETKQAKATQTETRQTEITQAETGNIKTTQVQTSKRRTTQKEVEQEEVTEEIQKKLDTIFTKEQLVLSKRYKASRDVVQSLLEEKKQYTLEQVDTIIKEFMKRSVK